MLPRTPLSGVLFLVLLLCVSSTVLGVPDIPMSTSDSLETTDHQNVDSNPGEQQATRFKPRLKEIPEDEEEPGIFMISMQKKNKDTNREFGKSLEVIEEHQREHLRRGEPMDESLEQLRLHLNFEDANSIDVKSFLEYILMRLQHGLTEKEYENASMAQKAVHSLGKGVLPAADIYYNLRNNHLFKQFLHRVGGDGSHQPKLPLKVTHYRTLEECDNSYWDWIKHMWFNTGWLELCYLFVFFSITGKVNRALISEPVGNVIMSVARKKVQEKAKARGKKES